MDIHRNNHFQWPKKRREIHNHHMDSTVWNDFQFRDDDIIIGTHIKSGTTWVQQMVSQLLFKGAEGVHVASLSPWIDMRIPAKEEKLSAVEAQTHRRVLKTHLPVDALVYYPMAKYIYICRDARDIVWSLYNHHANASEFYYQVINDTPGRVGPPLEPPNASVREYFLRWLERDGYPYWPFWENLKSWWEIRSLPNLLFLHYQNLLDDMPCEIRRIAKFLEVEIEESTWLAILHHCSMDYMRKHGESIVPLEGKLWRRGAKNFIHKGTNGRWRDILMPEDNAAYCRMADEKLGKACAQWLATGIF